MSNQQFTPSNNINKIKGSHSKEKTNKFLSTFNNFSSNQNQITNFILSENQRNINKFKSQKKIKQKDSYSKNLTENKHSTFFDSNNINNIKLKNYSNIMIKNSKLIRNMNSKNKYKTKNKSQSLLKPNIEIETPNSTNTNHNIDNMSTNAHSRLNTNNNTNNKRYKKNISEHDLVKNNNNDMKRSLRQNGTNNINNLNRPKTASETKLFRSSSGYSYINNNLFYTNSFFNGFNGDIPNQVNYIPTWGNNQECNNNGNNNKQKNNKQPIIGKIIKNYKNNDLNCIFNMNLIPPSSVNNIQDYFKNLYKVEYNGDGKNKKHEKNGKKEKDNIEGINLKFINEENKRVMESKLNEIKNKKLCEESVEEIHYYYVNMIQEGKIFEKKLIKK